MTASWIAVASYMALIFVVSGASFRSDLFEDAQKIHADWLVHVVEYSVLGFLLSRALKRSARRLRGTFIYAAVLAIGVAYAASDEYHQSFVPSRDASLHDGLADTAGLALGAWLWTRRQKENRSIDA